jgi:hypothetical protein
MDFTSFIKSSQKRQRYLLFIFVVVVLVIAFVVWNYFLVGRPEPSTFIPIPPPEVKINFELLDNPDLDNLQPFKVIQPFEGTPGRENPFVPY